MANHMILQELNLLSVVLCCFKSSQIRRAQTKLRGHERYWSYHCHVVGPEEEHQQRVVNDDQKRCQTDTLHSFEAQFNNVGVVRPPYNR